jgi:hypothetical protein
VGLGTLHQLRRGDSFSKKKTVMGNVLEHCKSMGMPMNMGVSLLAGAGNNDAANAERLAAYLNDIFPSMLDDEIVLGSFGEHQDLLDDPMEVEEASDLGNATVEIPHELFTTPAAVRSTDDQAEVDDLRAPGWKLSTMPHSCLLQLNCSPLKISCHSLVGCGGTRGRVG